MCYNKIRRCVGQIMSNVRNTLLGDKIKKIISATVIVIVAILGGATAIINVENGQPHVEIQYAEQSVPTYIENEAGQIEEIEAPTVESIDADNSIIECNEEEGCLGQGSAVILPSLDITSPQTVYQSVINQCIDLDGYYGSQCVDLFAYYHYAYTGRWLSTNGTGAAYGIWDARDYNNSGNEYELITDVTKLQPGDFAVFHNGHYGHVGMVMGYYNNGYIALLGTNQGGYACDGGGAAANVVNISLATFSGAFRPRIYIHPEPTPEPTPEPSQDVLEHIYVKGDTFGQVLIDLGLSDGTDLWGADGKVAKYNKQLEAQKYVVYEDGKYWGNIPVGSNVKLEK